MTTYTITVNIPDSQTRSDLVAGDYVLTLATGVSASNKEHYNIGAFTSKDIAPSTSISWTTDYQLDATKTSYKPGYTVSISSDSLGVDYGQGYFLDKWSGTPSVKTDQGAPKNGFTFHNGMTASSLLSQNIEGNLVPVFISPSNLIPGTETLIPITKAKVWFQNSFKTSTMVSEDISTSFTADLTNKSSVTLTYDENNGWSLA